VVGFIASPPESSDVLLYEPNLADRTKIGSRELKKIETFEIEMGSYNKEVSLYSRLLSIHCLII
jgi:hypothetical protein